MLKKKNYLFTITTGLIAGTTLYLASKISIEIPAILAGIAIITTTIVWGREKLNIKPFIPYIILIGLLIGTRISPVKETLQAISFTIGPHTFQPLYHPLPVFLAVCSITIIAYSMSKKQVNSSVNSTIAKIKKVALPLLLILLTVQLIQYSNNESGQSIPQAIAEGIIKISTPITYIIASPLIGMAGTFITGSNTVSNLMLSGIQHSAATQLGLSNTLILGLQTSGAAIGNMIALHNIIAATAIIGLVNRESEIFRRLLKYAIMLGITAGIIGLILHLL
jgi:lactate permease